MWKVEGHPEPFSSLLTDKPPPVGVRSDSARRAFSGILVIGGSAIGTVYALFSIGDHFGAPERQRESGHTGRGAGAGRLSDCG